MNRDLRTYIDICHKESERRAVYLEQSTSHLNNVLKIAVNNDSITPQNKQNGIEEYHQEYHKRSFDGNE